MSQEDPVPGGTPVRTVVKAVRPHQTRPGPRDLEDRAYLAEEVKGSLERVRKTAENWKTGMAGLTALVTATLLFKGRNSISDYAGCVGYLLGALVLVALLLAVASLWLFLAASYGRVAATSAQSILDAGGVEVHNVRLATVAVRDLVVARWLGLASAGFLAAGLLISWYGPAAKGSTNQVAIVIASESSQNPEQHYCGELKALDKDNLVLQVDGEPNPRRWKTQRLISFKVVTSCN
jgi:hypothetical protein